MNDESTPCILPPRHTWLPRFCHGRDGFQHRKSITMNRCFCIWDVSVGGGMWMDTPGAWPGCAARLGARARTEEQFLRRWIHGFVVSTSQRRRAWFLKLRLSYAHSRCLTSRAAARQKMRQVLQYLDGAVAVPELAMTNLDYSSLMFVQNEGFDSYVMLDASSLATSIGPGSNHYGGRWCDLVPDFLLVIGSGQWCFPFLMLSVSIG